MSDRPCREPGCSLAASPRSQRCAWHRLSRLKIAEQDEAARRRLSRAESAPGYLYRPRLPKAATPPGTRWCAGCQSLVPTFYASGSRCRACARAGARASRNKATYGITAEDYAALLAGQGGGCGICGRQQRDRALAVDHDHITDEVRGLLCKNCNHDLLGAAHDDVEILRRAVAYLESPPARRLLAA